MGDVPNETQEYVTLLQVRTFFGLSTLDEFPIDPGGSLDKPFSQLIANTSSLGVFNYIPESFNYDGGNLAYYPTTYNTTYILDMSGTTTNATIKLDYYAPILGDRLLLIIYGIGNNTYGIQDNIRKIYGRSDKILFTDMTNIILQLTYASIANGWHISNYWWGNS